MQNIFSSIAKGINLDSFGESKQDFLEKGRRAQVGEIRTWNNQKFQKQPNGGWIPVANKQGVGAKSDEKDWKNSSASDLQKLPEKTKLSFWEPSSGTIMHLEKTDKGWKDVDENTDWSNEEVADGLKYTGIDKVKVEMPKDEPEKDSNKNFEPNEEQKKYLERFFDPQDMVDNFYPHRTDDWMDFSDFKKKVLNEDKESRKMGIETLQKELGISSEQADKVYDEWTKKALDIIEESPKDYGLNPDEGDSSYNEEFGVNFDNIRDEIGDGYSNAVIQTALDELSENGWDKNELIIPKDKRQSPASASRWAWDRARRAATDLGHYTKDEVESPEDLAYGIIQALSFYDNKPNKK